MRANMSGGKWWRATFTTSFRNVLTIQERLSPHSARSSMMWVGSDATLGNCDAVNRTLKTFTVFRANDFADFSFNLAGLRRGGYELVSITEYMSLICFLVAQGSVLKGQLICYVGDNLNVVTWANRKRPGARVAEFFTRILSRLEDERGFCVGANVHIAIQRWVAR